MNKTITYSKRHHIMEQSADKFDDVLDGGKLNPAFSSGESSSTVNSPSHAATSMEEEEFLTLSSQRNDSCAAVNHGLCRKPEVNKGRVAHRTYITAGNTLSSLDDKNESMFHEDESFTSETGSRYTYVTVTNTDYLSSPELVREEERPHSVYPAAQGLLFEDLKAKTDYTEDASLLSDEDEYSDNPLFMEWKESKVDFEPKPKFTSTLLDPVTGKDEQPVVFSQVLSTVCGVDSGWDEKSNAKQVPERAGSMRSNVANRKAFTIKAKPRLSLQPKTSTLLFDESEKPAFCRDDLSSIAVHSAKHVYQPSDINCETTSGKQVTLSDVSMKKQTCDTNSNQSPHSTSCRNRTAKMTSTPNPEGISSPFTLNLSPINRTCSSSELDVKQSVIVRSNEIVVLDTDSEQEMMLAKAEINQIRMSQTMDHDDVCCKISEHIDSPNAYSLRKKQKQSTKMPKDVQKGCEIPLCCIAEFPDTCTNRPGRRLIKTAENKINAKSVPDDILESLGENLH